MPAALLAAPAIQGMLSGMGGSGGGIPGLGGGGSKPSMDLTAHQEATSNAVGGDAGGNSGTSNIGGYSNIFQPGSSGINPILTNLTGNPLGLMALGAIVLVAIILFKH